MKELLCSRRFEKPLEIGWMEDYPLERCYTKKDFQRELLWFSERWHIDMDLFCEEEWLEAFLYFFRNRFAGILFYDLQHLLYRSDEMEISAGGGYQSVVILRYKKDREF